MQLLLELELIILDALDGVGVSGGMQTNGETRPTVVVNP
jgi:hypothetical protein